MRQFQTVLCGDQVVDPTEGCDDGALAGLDGCNASCDVEEFRELAGSAAGGSVSVTISGQVVTVTTTAGRRRLRWLRPWRMPINANTAPPGSRDHGDGPGRAGDHERGHFRIDGDRLWLPERPRPSGREDASLVGRTLPVRRATTSSGGNLDQLRSTAGNFASSLVTRALSRQQSGLTRYWLHAETPAVGQGVRYLVRATARRDVRQRRGVAIGFARMARSLRPETAAPEVSGPAGRRNVISSTGRRPGRALSRLPNALTVWRTVSSPIRIHPKLSSGLVANRTTSRVNCGLSKRYVPAPAMTRRALGSPFELTAIVQPEDLVMEGVEPRGVTRFGGGAASARAPTRRLSPVGKNAMESILALCRIAFRSGS